MKRLLAIFQFLALICLPVSLYAQENIHHNMKVVIDPEKHWIDIEDKITLPNSFFNVGGGEVHFIIHKGLQPVSNTEGVAITHYEDKAQSSQSETNSNSIFQPNNEMLEHYIVALPADERTFIVKYNGEIHSPLQKQKEESDRSFSETSGIISSNGIYLASSSYWY
ncbi:MAG: hypothetical protein QGF31_05330, partial [Nitrospinota bacterium]|nr:hypothetical protein [Nitrospinota bacterium]